MTFYKNLQLIKTPQYMKEEGGMQPHETQFLKDYLTTLERITFLYGIFYIKFKTDIANVFRYCS